MGITHLNHHRDSLGRTEVVTLISTGDHQNPPTFLLSITPGITSHARSIIGFSQIHR